jgi:hypothetical protein
VITIPPCLIPSNWSGVQKLTRTLSYHLTPYELTLAVDLDTYACGDLHPLLRQVAATERGRWDFAAAGHVESIWHPGAPRSRRRSCARTCACCATMRAERRRDARAQTMA